MHPEQPARVPVMKVKVRVRHIREQESADASYELEETRDEHALSRGAGDVRDGENEHGDGTERRVDEELPRPVARDLVQTDRVSEKGPLVPPGGRDRADRGGNRARRESIDATPTEQSTNDEEGESVCADVKEVVSEKVAHGEVLVVLPSLIVRARATGRERDERETRR